MFGVSLTVAPPDMQTIVLSAPKNNIIRPLGNYSYGASLIPDEDEEIDFPARYAIVNDTNSFPVEVHEKVECAERTCKLSLRVLDLDESVQFYTKVLGFQLLRRRSNVNNQPTEASMCAYVVIS